jgi:uncharacterized membrane protein YgcG
VIWYIFLGAAAVVATALAVWGMMLFATWFAAAIWTPFWGFAGKTFERVPAVVNNYYGNIYDHSPINSNNSNSVVDSKNGSIIWGDNYGTSGYAKDLTLIWKTGCTPPPSPKCPPPPVTKKKGSSGSASSSSRSSGRGSTKKVRGTCKPSRPGGSYTNGNGSNGGSYSPPKTYVAPSTPNYTPGNTETGASSGVIDPNSQK